MDYETLKNLIGQTLTADEIKSLAGEPHIRIQRPGSMHTQDFQFNRLNIVLGDEGQVINVTTG
jgi:hypothetical protein